MAVAPIERIQLATPTTGRNAASLAAPWLFTGEDNLRLMVVNAKVGVVVTVTGRYLVANDPTVRSFSHSVTPTADRMENDFDFGFGSGFLLNCTVIVTSGAPLIGQTYIMLQVIRGLSGSRLVLGCLLGGYVTAQQHIAYPGSPIQSSIEGGPCVRTIVGTAPAAGVDISETVPAGARWRLRSIYAILTTSAAAGNRQPYLSLESASGAFFISMQPYPATPSSTGAYCWASSLAFAVVVRAPFSITGLCDGSHLLALQQFRTNTFGLAAGDQWNAPIYLVDEWLEAA